jgi:hypothetical protein
MKLVIFVKVEQHNFVQHNNDRFVLGVPFYDHFKEHSYFTRSDFSK